MSGVTHDDAVAYASWLAATRVPGARLCTEREWERAARGADGRRFPRGDALHPGEANFDETYAMDFAQMGPDEVGAYGDDTSVFGAMDMTGNVAEWVASPLDAIAGGARVARGGYFYAGAQLSESAHRFVAVTFTRADSIGLRVCAAAPAAN